jgi:hypothetical protein
MDEKAKRTKGTLPVKEADLKTVAREAVVSWKKRPHITLLWTDPQQFETSVGAFGTSYAERKDVKGSRRSVTLRLRELNAEINVSIGVLKSYLTELYGKKTAPVHYTSFGIGKYSGRHIFPVDNDRRLYALNQLLKGLEQHKLTDRKYGTEYWSDLRDRFAETKQQASEADKTSTEHVSIKAQEKALIRKTLNALVNAIKANHPDTWKEELRIWGFQKEKY